MIAWIWSMVMRVSPKLTTVRLTEFGGQSTLHSPSMSSGTMGSFGQSVGGKCAG